MSMSCSLYRLTEAQTQSLLRSPEAVLDLLGNAPLPPKTSFLSRLFGKARMHEPPHRETLAPIAESETLELDQAWHILHYLLSGSDSEGDLPAAFIMSGGQEIGPDLGYGPARLLDTNLSEKVATFLAAQSQQAFEKAYNTKDVEAAKIYWEVSSEPDERRAQIDELWGLVQEMRSFLKQTVQTRGTTLIQIY